MCLNSRQAKPCRPIVMQQAECILTPRGTSGHAASSPQLLAMVLSSGFWWPESWWRHQMETFSALLALCAGNSPVSVKSPHKGQWRGALMFSFIYAWINDWVNNREAGDLRRQDGHYDVIVMMTFDKNGGVGNRRHTYNLVVSKTDLVNNKPVLLHRHWNM